MADDIVLHRLLESLVEGNRIAARGIVSEQVEKGVGPEELLTGLLWPAYELVDRLNREDELSTLSANIATRLLRVLVDRVAGDAIGEGNAEGRRVLAFCGEHETEELGAQIAVDLLEASGHRVVFAGGGLPADEVLGRVHDSKPDVLLAFCSAASDLPGIRKVIDSLREIGACPDTQVVVGGGVFNRAEGLAEEIGADLWAEDPLELVDMVTHESEHRADESQRTVGKSRRVRSAA